MVIPLPSDVTTPDTAPADKRRNPGTPDDLPRIVARRHIGRWLTAAAALLVFAMAVNSVVRNDAFLFFDVVGPIKGRGCRFTRPCDDASGSRRRRCRRA